jgi:hypothetical protein
MAVIETRSAGNRGIEKGFGGIDWRSPWTMFWVGLLVRVLYIVIVRPYHIKPIEDHFQFGWEMGRIARALASGYGYSDPFVGHTGPTAWSPPLYPLLIAGVFKLFGIYTAASGFVILVCNSIFSAAMIPAIYEIAVRCYSNGGKSLSVARWSGWLWALYPAAMQYAVRWIWEMSLTTMLFVWVLVMALRIRGIGETAEAGAAKTIRRWMLFGLLWGLIALSNPTPILFLPVCGLWLVFTAKNKVTAIQGAVLAGIVCVGCLVPWAWRNWRVFHTFIPIRGNLGAELYAGNGPGSEGFPWGTTLPLVERAPELIRYKEMGEVRYVKSQGERAKAYMHAHPQHFVEITLKRFFFYWEGVPHAEEGHPALEYTRELNFCFFSITGLLGAWLSIRRRIPAAKVFACTFLFLPLSYYIVTPGARFRHPLEPLITILSVYLFQSAEKSWRVRWFSRG